MDDKPSTESREMSAVREADIQPYTALGWVGTLFKAAAVFLGVAILAEFIAGLRFQGTDALPVLLGEVMRMLVLGIVLWGAGDLVRLMIDMGHDFRAGRILLGRISSRIPAREDRADGQAEMEPAERETEGEIVWRAPEAGERETIPGETASEEGEEPRRGPRREAA